MVKGYSYKTKRNKNMLIVLIFNIGQVLSNTENITFPASVHYSNVYELIDKALTLYNLK